MDNRVLALPEVLALEDGAEVWVEEAFPEFASGVNTVMRASGHVSLEPPAEETCGPYWPGSIGDCFGNQYRVWLHRPTDAERSAEPWKEM